MQQENAIEICGLGKTYRGAVKPAIDNISLNIRKGEIFGLLGPNGAGKTTTISILCGMFAPGKGDVYIEGHSIKTDSAFIKSIIGVVPQEIALYPSLTAVENLKFIGRMYGIGENSLRKRIAEMLELLGLTENARKKLSTYSGGMKRRVNLIAGLLHKPRILFLDEPTVGVDVQSRNVILDYLRSLNRDGMTIIYTSHYLQEAESLCHRIALIDDGGIIRLGTPPELLQENPDCSSMEGLFLKLTGKELRD
jgi:ABC-2 type transport system ATP-binding protein